MLKPFATLDQPSTELWRQAIDRQPAGIAFADLNGDLTYVNPAWQRLFGYDDARDVLGCRATTFADVPTEVAEMIDQTLANGEWVGELSARRQSGERFIVQVSATVLTDAEGATLGLMGSFVDITARQREEKAQRFFRSLVESATDPIFTCDPDGRYRYVNPAAAATVGQTPATLEGKTVDDLFAPDAAARMRAGLRRVVETGEVLISEEPITLQGRTVWFSNVLQPVRDAQGRIEMVQAVVRDVTRMKAAEEAAYRSEERLRQAVQVATIGVFDHDHLRGTIHLSSEHRELFGQSNATISDEGFQAPPGQWPTFLAAIHPDDREAFHTAVQRAQSSDPGILDVEFRFIHPQHGVRWIALRAQTFFDGDGAARHAVRTIGAARDISEQRRAAEERERLQQQSWQARKMESVGRLAGGVAHDFNNMLMAINGNADLALEEIDATHPLRSVLTDIRSAGERAADLTRRLLGFARRQDAAPRVIGLNGVVEESIKLLGRLIGEHIQLTWIPEPALGSVQIDPTQVDQILVNLVTNARDAIEDAGTITIRTAEAVLDDTYCAAHPGAVAGDYVVLQVVDTGVGIDEETRTQIFEPFYTTKPLGTGLGLATVYGIVKQNDGYVDVQSAAGQGTTIQVFLPRHTESPAIVDPGVPAESARGGPETVLVVEDQPMVQQVTIRMLKACGYTVLAASGPSAAMRVASEWTGTIHLLLTDVVMPEMNGGELARQLVSRYPHLKCMFVSGYAHGVTLPRSIDGQDFLPKPFTHVGLTAKVREILDRPLPLEPQAV